MCRLLIKWGEGKEVGHIYDISAALPTLIRHAEKVNQVQLIYLQIVTSSKWEAVTQFKSETLLKSCFRINLVTLCKELNCSR